MLSDHSAFPCCLVDKIERCIGANMQPVQVQERREGDKEISKIHELELLTETFFRAH